MMTVSELIEHLQGYPANARILVRDYDGDMTEAKYVTLFDMIEVEIVG